MKKLFLAFLVIMITFMSFGQTDKVDKVLTGVGNEITAIHTDTKDAISTLHQDASKIVETVYTDSKSIVGVLYEDVNKIVKYAAPKLEAGLIALAQTLKTTVNEVFKILVMKQIATAVGYAIVGIIMFIFIFLCYKILAMPDEKLLGINNYGENVWKTKWIISLILSVIGAISAGIIFATHFMEMLLGFIAPKYGALMELITVVERLIK